MNRKNLMIGDWVIDTKTGYVMQIAEVNRCYVLLKYPREFGLYCRGYEDIEPIDLTEEFMDKNFESRLDDWMVGNGWLVRNFYGWSMGKYNDAYETPSWCGLIDIPHVHNLQHAMKLMNIDKEIKP